MKKICILVFLILSLVACQNTQSKDPKIENVTNERPSLALEKLNEFSIKSSEIFFSNKTEENAAYSPLSFFYNLVIINSLTKNDTSKEISDALSMTQSDIEEIAKLYRNYKIYYGNEISENENKKLEALKEGFFGLDNSLWINEKQIFNTSVLPNIMNLFQTNVYKTDFSNQKNIEKYIQDFLGDTNINMPDFDSSCMMNVMNLLSLKDTWASGALKESTTEYAFEGKQTKMLIGQYENGRIYEEDTFMSFYINTKNGYRLSFILPKGSNSLKDIFIKENLKKVITKKYDTFEENTLYKTRCIFPEFNIVTSTPLKELCENLGVKSLFIPSFDLTLFTNRESFVQNINQNICIEVTKNGISASAITYTSYFGDNGQKTEYFDFIVDQSFGFVLTEVETNTLLFSGIIKELA